MPKKSEKAIPEVEEVVSATEAEAEMEPVAETEVEATEVQGDTGQADENALPEDDTAPSDSDVVSSLMEDEAIRGAIESAESEEPETESEPVQPKPKRRTASAARKSAGKADETVASDGEPTSDEASEEPSRPGSRRAVMAEAAQRERERAQRNEERAERLSSWASLQAAMATGRVVYADICGIQVADMKGREREDVRNAVLVVALYDNKYRITIPFGELYCKYPIDMSTVNLNTESGRNGFIARQRAMAEKLYGLRVPLIIEDMFMEPASGKHSIVASRAKAIARQENANFKAKRDGSVVMKPGDIVPATVTSVSDYSIAVNVGGVDTRMSVHALTYRFISGPYSLKSLFSVGETIDVQISSVKELPDGSHSVEVTRKPIELEEAKKKQNSIIMIDQDCYATVTGILPGKTNDNVYVALYLKSYDMPAISNRIPPSKAGFTPKVGDVVRVTIKGFNESGMTYCWIRGAHGAPNMLGSSSPNILRKEN